MTDIRSQLSVVFAKHGWKLMDSDYDVIPCRDPRRAELLRYIPPSLLNDLLACWPHTDLAQLDAIFQRHDYTSESREDWMEAVKEDLINWARDVQVPR